MKRKVFILCGSLKTGGAEKVAQSIALHGNTEQYEYHYLVFHQDQGVYEEALRALGCIIHRFREPSDNYFLFIRNLLRLLRSHHFQVIHGHTMFNCGIIMLCAWFCRIPIRISHAHSSLAEKQTIPRRIYEVIMRFLILVFSTDLVACSKSAGNRLYGGRNFRVIPNGIDISSFAYEEASRIAIRSSLNLNDALIIGHTGRMVSVKNQMFLLELMPQLLYHAPNAVLLLLGDGEDRLFLEEKIRQLDLTDHVILAGSQQNVSAYLSAMDVFVLPSLFEGMPLSLLEAQANGLPCVVSDTISSECFFTDLVHPESLQAPRKSWIKTILSLRRNNPKNYCTQLLDSEFNCNHCVDAIHQIYTKHQHDQNSVSD